MKKIVFSVLILVSIFACKKSKKPENVPLPAKAALISPASNEVCTEGNVISLTQSSVVFKWSKAENTDSYILKVKNLLSGLSTSFTTTALQQEVALARNTPYSWSVESKSAKEIPSVQSDIWKFYMAGAVSQQYAPFPAEAVAPVYGQQMDAVNSKITLDWDAADVDNDISGYDVYIGTSSNSVTLLQANVSKSVLPDVSVNTATGYYWKVITRDLKGNTSDSGIFFFRIN